jgi:hypothetical protein
MTRQPTVKVLPDCKSLADLGRPTLFNLRDKPSQLALRLALVAALDGLRPVLRLASLRIDPGPNL